VAEICPPGRRADENYARATAEVRAILRQELPTEQVAAALAPEVSADPR